MAEVKYVSRENLIAILGKIKETYVMKETGKGLSTNDLTNELLAKINGMGTLATLNEVGESNLSADLLAKVNASTEANHSHTNKALLDTYTQTEADLADAVSKKHAHANAAELDLIASGDKAKWDKAVTDLAAEITRATGAEQANATAASNAQSAADKAQGDVDALTTRVGANETAIGVLNGTGDGSVAKQITDAFNDFSTKVTDDGVVNSYKELIDYASEHGAEFTELVGSVTANTNAIATLNGDASTAGSVAKTVADAIASENLAQYAKGTDLTAATDRIKAIEDDYVKASDLVAFTDAEIDEIWAAA